MNLKLYVAAISAVCLAAAPVAAAQPVRASAPTTEASDLLGNNSVAIGVIAAFALLIVIVLATGGDDSPTSP